MAVVQERLVEAGETVVSDRRSVGEQKTFRPYDPDQVSLMAPALSEWVPEGYLRDRPAGLLTNSHSARFDLLIELLPAL